MAPLVQVSTLPVLDKMATHLSLLVEMFSSGEILEDHSFQMHAAGRANVSVALPPRASCDGVARKAYLCIRADDWGFPANVLSSHWRSVEDMESSGALRADHYYDPEGNYLPPWTWPLAFRLAVLRGTDQRYGLFAVAACYDPDQLHTEAEAMFAVARLPLLLTSGTPILYQPTDDDDENQAWAAMRKPSKPAWLWRKAPAWTHLTLRPTYDEPRRRPAALPVPTRPSAGPAAMAANSQS